MAWSYDFRERIGARTAFPRFVLQEVRLPTSDRVGERWAISSHGDDGPQLIGNGGVDAIGSYIVAPSMSARIGEWQVPLSGDISWLMDRVTRGQIVRLKVGFQGWNHRQFETVALGAVWGISGRAGRWVMVVRDIFSALTSRRTVTDSKFSLFSNAGTATTLSSGYTVTDTTLALTSATGFDDPPSTEPAAVKVTPDSGDDFYLTYTGVSGSTLTGVSAAAVYGTTAGAAAAGKAVVAAGWLKDYPGESALRVLVSTGTAGLHGAYDVLPETWGYAFPSSFVDASDVAHYKPWGSPLTGSADASWLSITAQANGGGWLHSQLSMTHHFLAMRMGRITVRPSCVPQEIPTTWANSSASWPVADTITHDDIASVDSWDAWSRDYQSEYRSVIVSTDGGTTTRSEDVSTVPAIQALAHDASAVIKDNESAYRTHLSRRLAPWYGRVPESISLTLAGHRLATLCPGDVVRVTTDIVPGRLPTTLGGYSGRHVVVSGVSPYWFGAPTVRLTGYVLPTRQDGF